MAKHLIILSLALLLPALVLADTRRADRCACEEDVIEVMFVPESRVRIRNGKLKDLAVRNTLGAVAELNSLVPATDGYSWSRIGAAVPEARADELRVLGEARAGKTLYDMNNVYHLRVPEGTDPWEFSEQLASLPGVMRASPQPLPVPPPLPTSYFTSEKHHRASTNTPSGFDSMYAWSQVGGNGITVAASKWRSSGGRSIHPALKD